MKKKAPKRAAVPKSDPHPAEPAPQEPQPQVTAEQLAECIIAMCGCYVPGGWAHPGEKCVQEVTAVITEHVSSLLAERDTKWKTWGMTQIGARNRHVASYCEHWENRATTAEATVAELTKWIGRAKQAEQERNGEHHHSGGAPERA